jgi:hypothetical protein
MVMHSRTSVMLEAGRRRIVVYVQPWAKARSYLKNEL